MCIIFAKLNECCGTRKIYNWTNCPFRIKERDRKNKNLCTLKHKIVHGSPLNKSKRFERMCCVNVCVFLCVCVCANHVGADGFPSTVVGWPSLLTWVAMNTREFIDFYSLVRVAGILNKKVCKLNFPSDWVSGSDNKKIMRKNTHTLKHSLTVPYYKDVNYPTCAAE